MNDIKHCIVHVPWKLTKDSVAASEIRPKKMRQAFEDLGYQVIYIMGDNSERMMQIHNLKSSIKNLNIHFMYSESSTLPMMLTDNHHLPSHPFVDLSLFRLCKKNKIPIGLFYRDIYWAYRGFKRFGFIKEIYTSLFHILDILVYNNYLKKIYLPFNNKELFYEKIPFFKRNISFSDLMPACNNHEDVQSKEDYFLYIGSIDPKLYDISLIMSAFQMNGNEKLKVCTTHKQWDAFCSYYNGYLNPNIEVVHYVNEQAQALIKNAKFGFCFFKKHEYRDIAVPLKVFDYLSWNTPIICRKDDYVGKIIIQNNLGIALEYTLDSLTSLIDNQDKIDQTQLLNSIKEYKKNNLWISRAKTVEHDLTESIS